ncbi:MAG: hypothetical protein ACYSYM_00355 [Planctomycetota bacterium]|jgi:hypothetical protein
MCASSNVEKQKKQNHKKPPRSVGRIACEILAGTVTGFVVAVLVLCVNLYVIFFVILGATADWLEEKNLGLGGLAAAGFILLAFPMLYGPASAVGVYLVGTRGNETGSFLATLGGGFLGLFVMILVYFYVFAAGNMLLGIEKIVLWPLVFLASPIVATLGFNLTRRYKEPPAT